MAVPLLLVAILICWPDITCQCTKDVFQIEESSCNWKCMTLAMMWPAGFCVGLRKQLECSIPQSVSSWTIHGLWPMKEQNCCGCWPVFQSDLEELEPEISHLWPSLVKNRPNFAFWKHEWQDHGACAACMEGLNSPTRYFQAALKQRGRFDIDRALMNANIKPTCNQTYQLDDLHAALSPITGDKFEIQCIKDDEGREVLVQLKMLMDRNFTLGCSKNLQRDPNHDQRSWKGSPGHPCPQDKPVHYFPISYQHPHDPCN